MNPAEHPREYDRPIAAGEFILGYENEYGEKPLSPHFPAHLDTGNRLPAVPGSRKDLGHHGTYLVLRKLSQDVGAFNAFLEEHKGMAPCHPCDPGKQKMWLKAKLIGRWPSGAPLEPGQTEEPALTRIDGRGISNDFDFRADRGGHGCPVTSHVRRANPRDSLPASRKISKEMSRRHRIVRRGIPYGRKAEDSAPTEDRGLVFIALNANLERQFEFIQQSWMNNEKFGGLYDERDPVSSSGDSGRLTIPAPPLRKSVAGLSRFVTMKGGGYFFLPSAKALRFLADFTCRKPVPGGQA
jgi:Dyp-type peroxidase family